GQWEQASSNKAAAQPETLCPHRAAPLGTRKSFQYPSGIARSSKRREPWPIVSQTPFPANHESEAGRIPTSKLRRSDPAERLFYQLNPLLRSESITQTHGLLGREKSNSFMSAPAKGFWHLRRCRRAKIRTRKFRPTILK